MLALPILWHIHYKTADITCNTHNRNNSFFLYFRKRKCWESYSKLKLKVWNFDLKGPFLMMPDKYFMNFPHLVCRYPFIHQVFRIYSKNTAILGKTPSNQPSKLFKWFVFSKNSDYLHEWSQYIFSRKHIYCLQYINMVYWKFYLCSINFKGTCLS